MFTKLSAFKCEASELFTTIYIKFWIRTRHVVAQECFRCTVPRCLVEEKKLILKLNSFLVCGNSKDKKYLFAEQWTVEVCLAWFFFICTFHFRDHSDLLRPICENFNPQNAQIRKAICSAPVRYYIWILKWRFSGGGIDVHVLLETKSFISLGKSKIRKGPQRRNMEHANDFKKILLHMHLPIQRSLQVTLHHFWNFVTSECSPKDWKSNALQSMYAAIKI